MASDREKARGRRQFILIGSAAVVLATLLSLVWLLVLRTPLVPAFTGLKANDAAVIVEELKRQKIAYGLDNDGSTILVPQDQLDATRLSILGGDLPLKGTVGFELFSKSDMGLTEFAQKINYQRALQGELARTLMSMSTVETARVHITLPEAGVFQESQLPAKASVTISPKPATIVDGRAVMGIQRLVASAVEGLDAGNVVVLDGAGKQLSADPFAGVLNPPAGVESNSVEQILAAKVRSVLVSLVGDPAMRVSIVMPAKRADTSPANPAHPLRITLTLSTTPPSDLEKRAAPLLKSAVGFEPAVGDTLEIASLPPSSPFQVGTPMASASGPPRTGDEPPPGGPWTSSIAWTMAAALAVIAGLLFLGRPRRDTSAKFAVRLRGALARDEETGRG